MTICRKRLENSVNIIFLFAAKTLRFSFGDNEREASTLKKVGEFEWVGVNFTGSGRLKEAAHSGIGRNSNVFLIKKKKKGVYLIHFDFHVSD